MSNYPLLIKGFFSNPNGSSNSIVTAPGTRVSWNNTTAQQRGDMIMLDVVMTNIAGGIPDSIFNLMIGGLRVLTNQRISRYSVNAVPRSFELLQLRQPSGQTIQLDYNNTGADSDGAIVHTYYENKFGIASVIAARNTAVLKQRILSVSESFPGGVRLTRGQTFKVPTAIGNIVAVELCSYIFGTSSDVVLTTSTISVLVNGETIFEDAASILFKNDSGRPGLIFPVVIRPGSTILIEANTEASPGTDTLTVDMRWYFDNDATGTMQYA